MPVHIYLSQFISIYLSIYISSYLSILISSYLSIYLKFDRQDVFYFRLASFHPKSEIKYLIFIFRRNFPNGVQYKGYPGHNDSTAKPKTPSASGATCEACYEDRVTISLQCPPRLLSVREQASKGKKRGSTLERERCEFEICIQLVDEAIH
ncbi:unnamed protein product [Acanthosepion pharaonis]|uniref:Uncharacterized protein n=1 Tax=Acanthosepion pharaonis TaxID=158019 RepID=A0A812CN64_ACAPH|nr:unnamed protein product [Sepia pharaonis]